MTLKNTISEIWYTRCPVATPLGLADRLGYLEQDFAREGIAIVVISSDLPEIIGIADRALVMREGRIAGEVTAAPGAPIAQEQIMTLSTGAIADTVQQGASGS